VPETRSAFGYYRKAIAELAKQFTVIGHAHPRAFRRYAPIYRSMGIEPVEDFAEVMKRASAYVCDNSSTLYEAATVMPVVVLNQPAYRRNVHHGLRFWEAADVGVQVDAPEQLAAGVAEALADAPERRTAREAALDVVYAHRDGARERAVSSLRAWSGVSQAVAA
jgi:spore coat polysaccharide biosynthesis predicted glycosyltransferase SpsG